MVDYVLALAVGAERRLHRFFVEFFFTNPLGCFGDVAQLGQVSVLPVTRFGPRILRVGASAEDLVNFKEYRFVCCHLGVGVEGLREAEFFVGFFAGLWELGFHGVQKVLCGDQFVP